MLDADYQSLKSELFEKFETTEAKVKETEQAGEEFPAPITEGLRYIVCAIRADVEFSKGHKEVALKEIRKALSHVSRAGFDVLEYRFLARLKRARTARASYRKHEDLALGIIDNYKVHSKNLREISNLVEKAKLPSKDSKEYQAAYEEKTQKLQAFLEDFGAVKDALLVAIDKDRKASQVQKTNTLVSVFFCNYCPHIRHSCRPSVHIWLTSD